MEEGGHTQVNPGKDFTCTRGPTVKANRSEHSCRLEVETMRCHCVELRYHPSFNVLAVYDVTLDSPQYLCSEVSH